MRAPEKNTFQLRSLLPYALMIAYGLLLLAYVELSDLTAHPQWLWPMLGMILLALGFASLMCWSNARRFHTEAKAVERRLTQEQVTHSHKKDALIERQRVQLEAAVEDLSASRRQYQSLFERTADALMILEDGTFTEGNPACLALFGCENLEEFLGVHPSELSPPFQADGTPSKDKADEMIRQALQSGSHRFEWLHQTRQGKVFPAEVLLTVIGDPDKPSICAIVRDITERKRAEEEIRFQAYYDSLTGLPNRRLMLDRINQALASSQRHHNYNALLFVDLDRFKLINDSLGHSIGDELLVQIAEILRHQIRDEDTVARFGGDEFVILLKHLGKDRDGASLKAERLGETIQQSISRTYNVNHHNIYVTSSIGIYLFPDQDDSLDDIIKQADTAMYCAKDKGRNQIAFFQSTMQEAVIKRLTLEKDLRQAVRDQVIEVYFQPLVSADRRIVGVEALVRWNHPVHGFINPEEFIAVAEDSGIIYELSNFVLHQSIEQIMALPDHPPKLSINVSPYQFRHPDFQPTIAGLIEHYHLPDKFLVLEITEGVVINDFKDTVERLHRLRALGVQIALDDFGTGYSSLSYLKQLPIDEIKIDRSFIKDMEVDPRDALLVRTIIDIAHQFKLVTVAEGVENETQQAFLHRHDCKVYQGYLYSRPLPIGELESFIANFAQDPAAG